MMKKRFKRMTLLLLVSMMVLLVLPAASSVQTSSGADKAMWIWEPWETIGTSVDRQALVDFAVLKGVNVLYVETGRSTGSYLLDNPNAYKDLITKASAEQIFVYALDGAAEWAKSQNHQIPLSRVDDVLNYNSTAASTEKFTGIQMDIEPYLLKEWDRKKQREKLIADYLDLMVKLDHKVTTTSNPIPFMASIPFWFDNNTYDTTYEGTTKHLAFHVIDIVSGGVAIMAYRDFATGNDSIIYHSQTEVDYAGQIGRRAVIGVEIQLMDLDKISFYEEGEAYMNAELQIVDEHYKNNSGYGGQAIHKYRSYRDMLQ